MIITFLLLTFGFQLSAQTFDVSFEEKLLEENFTGNVLLYLSKENRTPKNVFVGLELIPVYRIEVEDLKANKAAKFNDKAISYPVELSNTKSILLIN